MSADLKAATAESQKLELEPLMALHEQALKLWTQAADRCDGRSKERAQRNLADGKRQLEALAERQSSGAQCEVSHHDATALQDLARQAFSERRWAEAAALYRKSETMWDFAIENCSGSQQELAAKRREQAEIDAHNAAVCAPLFDRAREFTQKFRASASGLAPNEKQQQSLMAETLWRETVGQCKGAAADLANNNAQALARERGTPWVATAAPAPAPVARPQPAAKPAAATAVAAAASAPAAAQPAAKAASSAATAPPPLAAAKAPADSPAKPAMSALDTIAQSLPKAVIEPPKQIDVQSGDTRYKGLFVREEGQVVTGSGRVEWSNGDAYEGQLLRSRRHGKGELVWANGQRYKGDWVDDKPSGQGQLRFANGNQYEGAVLDGQPQGLGEMAYASGDRYQGEMRQGVPHGRGLYRWANGQQFNGDWAHEKPHGRGTLRFANGNVYEGAVQAGLPHGRGKLEFASGDVYEGEFDQGAQQGLGVYTWKAGERYEGAWRAGRKHGQGSFVWASGDRWVGEFKDDERTENGTLTRKEQP
jgi:hypothetical protein